MTSSSPAAVCSRRVWSSGEVLTGHTSSLVALLKEGWGGGGGGVFVERALWSVQGQVGEDASFSLP